MEAYIGRLNEMAKELKASFPENATEAQRLALLDKYLFEDLGVRGSRFEYYSRSNSYLNEVIDDLARQYGSGHEANATLT